MLRFEQGLTQDDIGYILNVTKSCICCYENGLRKPSLEILIEIASYFRVSIDFLIGMDSYDKKQNIKLTSKDIMLIEKLKDNPIIYKEIIDDMDSVILKINNVIKEQ